MTDSLTPFVDETLRETVRQWMRERDTEPAAKVNECPRDWPRKGPMLACKRYAALSSHYPAHDKRVFWARGKCREQQFVRQLCTGGIVRRGGFLVVVPPRSATVNPLRDIRWQARVQPDIRYGPVADVIDIQDKVIYEHKSMYIPVHLRAGRILPSLAEAVRDHARQVRKQRGWAAPATVRRDPSRQSVMPQGWTHELVYRLEDLPAAATLRQRIREAIVNTARDMGVRAHVLSFSGA
jgi:hypothetical protein